MGNNFFGQLGLGDTINRNVPTLLKGYKVKQIATGKNHTIFTDFDDNIYVMGYNLFGQLGLGDFGEDTNRDIPTLLKSYKAKQITAGGSHTIFIQ